MLRRAGLRQAAKVAHYALIVLAAWAASAVVVRVLSLDLDPKISAKAPEVEDSAKTARTKRPANDAVILKRNLFGATDLDVAPDESTAVGGDDLILRGIASTKASSWAVFENTASGEQNVFGIGEKIFEGPKLLAVDPKGADVLLRGKKRRYELEEEEPTSAEADDSGRGKKNRDKQSGAKSAKTEKAAKGAATSGVKKTGENAYLVDRREIEQVIANLNQVITQARAVPVLADGKSSGFKLFSIRPGSIFEKVGLEDGDIVQKVNDTELTDPSKAVGLLEEIQSMAQIRVNFVRSGKPRSYTYTIQ